MRAVFIPNSQQKILFEVSAVGLIGETGSEVHATRPVAIGGVAAKPNLKPASPAAILVRMDEFLYNRRG